MTSIMGEFFNWWYTISPKKLINFLFSMLKYLYHFFSIPYLIKSLFAPWKGDTKIPINPSIQDQLKALVDNIIARVMGMIVRSLTVVGGAISLILFVSIFAVFFIFWYGAPLISLILFFYGIKTL